MNSQPVYSIFLSSPPPSGTWWTPGLSILWCCLPTSFFFGLLQKPRRPVGPLEFWKRRFGVGLLVRTDYIFPSIHVASTFNQTPRYEAGMRGSQQHLDVFWAVSGRTTFSDHESSTTNYYVLTTFFSSFFFTCRISIHGRCHDFASLEWVQRCSTELFHAFSPDQLNGRKTHSDRCSRQLFIQGHGSGKVWIGPWFVRRFLKPPFSKIAVSPIRLLAVSPSKCVTWLACVVLSYCMTR